MIEPIIQFFDKLVTKFSWPRMILIVVASALTVAGFSFFELYTGHFRLARIEAASNLLDKLIAQSKTLNVSDIDEAGEIHKALINDLRNYTKQSQVPIPAWLLKSFAAATPWMLLAIFMLIATKDSHRTAIAGIFIFSIPFVVIGAILPDLHSAWINYLIYPIICA